MHRTVLGLFFGFAAPVTALASGQPDPSFGDDGTVIIHADYVQPVGYEFASDVLIDHAGRYVVVGEAFGTSESDESIALVTRTLVSGMPDTSLGGSGFVNLQWQGTPLVFSYVRETTDGKLLVAGELLKPGEPNDITVVCRLTEDGQFDPAFGTAGCRALDVVSGGPGLHDGSLSGMQLQADGRVLVVGAPMEDPEDPRGFAIVRLLPNGDDDPSFGDPSKCPAPSPRCGIAFSPADVGDSISAGGLALDPAQGRILVGADINADAFKVLTAIRYTSDGDFDIAFEPRNFGSLTGNPATSHDVADVQVLPDSSVLVTGQLSFDGKSRVAVARLQANGMHDDLFGDAGRAVYAFDATAERNSPSRRNFLQRDGKLIVSGESLGTADHLCHVLRIDSATGVADATFAQNGISTPTTLNALSPNDCYTSAVVSDGRHVLVAGTSHANGQDSNVFLLRLDQDHIFRDGLED